MKATTQSAKSSKHVTSKKKDTKHQIFKSVLSSPSDWSYDAPTRCMNRLDLDLYIKTTTGNNTSNSSPNHHDLDHQYANTDSGRKSTDPPDGQPLHKSESCSILNILDTHQFTPIRPDDIEESVSFNDESIESEMHHSMGNLFRNASADTSNSPRDAANRTHLTAGLVLLCLSSVLDAASLAYVKFINDVGFSIPQILMYQGLVQVLLCFCFGIITATLISRLNPSAYGIPRTASDVEFLSLVLPFSVQDNANFAKLCGSKSSSCTASRRIMQNSMANHNKYGSLNGMSSNARHHHQQAPRGSVRQMILAIFAFGVFQFTSHFAYFNGYLSVDTVGHSEIAPLFNGLAIGLAFFWSYMLYHRSMNLEEALYLLFNYIGIAMCGYSFIRYSETGGIGLLLCTANAYMLLSAFLESLAYVLIKYASHVPTFVLVFSSSVFCAILGLVLWRTSNEPFRAIDSFFELIQIASSGFIQFLSAWTFVRGTQLISIGTASFFRMTLLILCSILIQVFSIDDHAPHFYCILGFCLIILSFILMLIEKFGHIAKR